MSFQPPRAAAHPPGFHGLPGFSSGTTSTILPPAIAAMLEQATAAPCVTRNAWPWPPVTARVENGVVTTFPLRDTDRAELYIDDFADTSGAKITTKSVLHCTQ